MVILLVFPVLGELRAAGYQLPHLEHHLRPARHMCEYLLGPPALITHLVIPFVAARNISL